jgi:hypothetical protein
MSLGFCKYSTICDRNGRIGLFPSHQNRQGLKSLANNPTRLKTTQLLILNPLQRIAGVPTLNEVGLGSL